MNNIAALLALSFLVSLAPQKLVASGESVEICSAPLAHSQVDHNNLTQVPLGEDLTVAFPETAYVTEKPRYPLLEHFDNTTVYPMFDYSKSVGVYSVTESRVARIHRVPVTKGDWKPGRLLELADYIEDISFRLDVAEAFNDKAWLYSYQYQEDSNEVSSRVTTYVGEQGLDTALAAGEFTVINRSDEGYVLILSVVEWGAVPYVSPPGAGCEVGVDLSPESEAFLNQFN